MASSDSSPTTHRIGVVGPQRHSVLSLGVCILAPLAATPLSPCYQPQWVVLPLPGVQVSAPRVLDYNLSDILTPSSFSPVLRLVVPPCSYHLCVTFKFPFCFHHPPTPVSYIKLSLLKYLEWSLCS